VLDGVLLGEGVALGVLDGVLLGEGVADGVLEAVLLGVAEGVEDADAPPPVSRQLVPPSRAPKIAEASVLVMTLDHNTTSSMYP
jgi:hypothetical protein